MRHARQETCQLSKMSPGATTSVCCQGGRGFDNLPGYPGRCAQALLSACPRSAPLPRARGIGEGIHGSMRGFHGAGIGRRRHLPLGCDYLNLHRTT